MAARSATTCGPPRLRRSTGTGPARLRWHRRRGSRSIGWPGWPTRMPRSPTCAGAMSSTSSLTSSPTAGCWWPCGRPTRDTTPATHRRRGHGTACAWTRPAGGTNAPREGPGSESGGDFASMVAMDDDVTAAARPGYDVDRDGADSELAGLDDEADLARRGGWAKGAILGSALAFLGFAIGVVANGESSTVRSYASEILTFQGFETGLMTQALDDWGYSPTERSDEAMAWMGMGVPVEQMSGLLTDEQMDQLREAEGAGLDALFLDLVAEHHRGGLHMATYAAENAGDSDVRELAARIDRNQAKEINEYRMIAERLGYDIEIERATVPAEFVGD